MASRTLSRARCSRTVRTRLFDCCPRNQAAVCRLQAIDNGKQPSGPQVDVATNLLAANVSANEASPGRQPRPERSSFPPYHPAGPAARPPSTLPRRIIARRNMVQLPSSGIEVAPGLRSRADDTGDRQTLSLVERVRHENAVEAGSRLRADRPQPRSYSRREVGATGKAGLRYLGPTRKPKRRRRARNDPKAELLAGLRTVPRARSSRTRRRQGSVRGRPSRSGGR